MSGLESKRLAVSDRMADMDNLTKWDTETTRMQSVCVGQCVCVCVTCWAAELNDNWTFFRLGAEFDLTFVVNTLHFPL